MNNAIDRAISKLMNCSIADENCCNNPVTRAELYCILEAMKEPSPKPEMISIPKQIAYEYMQWAMGKPGYNQYATRRLESALDEALKDKQCSS